MARRVISQKLITAILLSREKRYILARKANLHPAYFSQIIHGHIPLKPDDERVLRIGKVLNIPKEELFEIEEPVSLEFDIPLERKNLCELQ